MPPTGSPIRRTAGQDMRTVTEARARQIRDYADYHAAVADFRRRRQADEQNRVNALLAELIAVLVPLFDEPACEVCPGCRYALSHGTVRCPRCAPQTERIAA